MKRMFFHIIGVIVVMLLFVPASYAQKEIDEARAELKAGNTVKAIEILKGFTKDNETNATGYVWLARAYMAVDSNQRAETELIKGRALAEANADIYTLLGDLYVVKKIYAAAEQQYAKAAGLDSTNIGLLLKLADSKLKARHYTDGAKTYNRILELDPQNRIALRTLGTLYVRAKQYANALPVLDILYPLEPDSIDVQTNYVRTLFETRNYEKMIPIAENLFQRDASLSDVQSMLGEAYKATRAFDRVVEIYQSKPVESMSIDELIGLAKAYRSLDQFEKAIATYDEVLKRDSSRCDILYDVGTTCMKVKNYARAVGMFERKIACDTSSGYRFASHLNAAMSGMQLKDFRGAEEHTLKSLELRPENVQAWMTLAQNYVQMGNVSKQRSAYKKVIELATADTANNGKYNSQLEEAYRMEGLQELLDKKYPHAIELLKKSLAINPRDCTTLLWTAQAYHNTNNKEEATKYYCRVLGLCPKNEDAKKGLEILGTGCGGTGR